MESTHEKVSFMKLIDFTTSPLSSRNLEYGGRAGEKKGIVFEGSDWILKFPKNTNAMEGIRGLSYVTSPLSEYLGSHIYELLGYEAHKTRLGVCFDGHRTKVVCACKDFIENPEEEMLIPYTALRNDTDPAIMARRDSSSFSASNINEIIFQLDQNTALKTIPGVKQRFWDCVVIDMLINNNDRNEDNWGVIKNRKTGSFRLSPIFDCGNCFYGKASEEKIALLLDDQERLLSSALNGITAYEDDDERRIRNLEILLLDNADLRESCERVYQKVQEKLKDIFTLIDDIPEEWEGMPVMSENRKRYYKETFRLRLEMILGATIQK